jgi:hypothetical protein
VFNPVPKPGWIGLVFPNDGQIVGSSPPQPLFGTDDVTVQKFRLGRTCSAVRADACTRKQQRVRQPGVRVMTPAWQTQVMKTRTSGQARVRDVIAALTLWVPLAVITATWLTWREALPADLPRQWNGLGVSTTWPTWLALVVLGLVSLASAGIATFALRTGAADVRRKTFLWTGFAAGLACGSWLLVAGSTIAAGPNGIPEVGALPLLLMVLTGYGVIPFLIAPTWLADSPEQSPAAVASVPTGVTAWSATVTAPLFAWLGVAMIGLAVTLVVLTAVGAGAGGVNVVAPVIFLIASLPMLVLARLRVSVDDRGLRVVSWMFGIPLKSLALPAIESAHTDTLEPLQWGGWGYRVMSGRSAIVLRKGPALVVNLTNGKQFALTLDEPETPAALLSLLSSKV